LPEFEDQPGQPKPGQPQPIAADDGPDDLPGASQPEEQGTSSQNVLQRWPDDSLPLPDPAALELLNQPLASVTEAAALNPLALAPAVTDVVPLMMANTERPSFLSPPDISQPMQQLALPDLPNGLPPTLGAALPTTPDTISSRQQLQQLTQPDLPSNLPAPSIPDFPITPDTIPSTQQFQQMAQPELPNNLPTMPDTMPKLPTLGNGTAVAHNLPNSLSDLPTPETLLGLDDTADEANIDEIARQVYRHLKRRLEMEWERTRSRR
jgi:hypothetical protein